MPTLVSNVTNYPMQTATGIKIVSSVSDGAGGGIISFSFDGGDGIQIANNLATIQAAQASTYGAGLTRQSYGLRFFTSYRVDGWAMKDEAYLTRSLRMEILSQPDDTSTSVKVTGICEATAGFNVSSALKYKTNIHDLPDNYNLDMLMKYRPIMYNLKVDKSENPKFFPGFIAEEIEELGANLFVTYKDEKPEALDYSRICVHLVKAMQEMKTDYDAKISKLERQYEEMQKKLETLLSSKTI